MRILDYCVVDASYLILFTSKYGHACNWENARVPEQRNLAFSVVVANIFCVRRCVFTHAQ